MTHWCSTSRFLSSTALTLVTAWLVATPAAHAAFVTAPPTVVEEATSRATAPVRIMVVGVGDEGKHAAAALRKALRGAKGVSLVMGGEALGALDGLDDFKVFKRARRMPIDRVAVVRVYPQGDGQPAMAIAPVYDKDGKTVSTVTFQENAAGGVAAPVPPRPKPMPNPETEGLAKTAPSNASPADNSPSESTTTTIAQAPKKEQRFSILVIDPVDSDTDADIRVAVAGRMAAELSTIRRFDVITAADIRAMTALEASRQLAGCNDESCLSEVADALGADLVVSWDVSNIGVKRIITTRLFDARNAKTVGRSQAESDSDEDLPAKAAQALRVTTDQFLRSLLDSGLARREEYEASTLHVTTAGIFGNGRAFSIGRQRVPIERLEFLRKAGETEKADDLEGSSALAILSLIVGVPTVGLGAVMVIVGSILTTTPAGFVGVALMLVGGIAVALGIVPILLAAFVSPVPPPIEEDRRIADEHNRRLRRKLGLPESASLTPRAPVLRALLSQSLAATAFALDVE